MAMSALLCWSSLFVLLCAVSEDIQRTPDISLSSLYSNSPLSSLPQPLGSGGYATPCQDTRDVFLNFLPPRIVAGWLLHCVARIIWLNEGV